MFYVNLADLVYWVGIDSFYATEQNYNFAVFMFVRVLFFRGQRVCNIGVRSRNEVCGGVWVHTDACRMHMNT